MVLKCEENEIIWAGGAVMWEIMDVSELLDRSEPVVRDLLHMMSDIDEFFQFRNVIGNLILPSLAHKEWKLKQNIPNKTLK